MAYKFVSTLSSEEAITLQEAFTKHSKHRVRIRAHSLLLSSEGYTIKQLSSLYKININTISEWISRWDSEGISMLFEAKGRGRKPIFTEEESQKLLDLVDEELSQLKRAKSLLEYHTGKSASLDTIKRTLKKITVLRELDLA